MGGCFLVFGIILYFVLAAVVPVMLASIFLPLIFFISCIIEPRLGCLAIVIFILYTIFSH